MIVPWPCDNPIFRLEQDWLRVGPEVNLAHESRFGNLQWFGQCQPLPEFFREENRLYCRYETDEQLRLVGAVIESVRDVHELRRHWPTAHEETMLWVVPDRIEELADEDFASGIRAISVIAAPTFGEVELLANFSNLRVLDLSWTPVSKLDALTCLSQLAALRLSPCGAVKDISVLRSMKNLRHLAVSTHQLLDLSSIQHLAELQSLSITNRDCVRDFRLSESFPRLRQIGLRATQEDIHDLAALKSLQAISLEISEPIDISPLADLEYLEQLYVSDVRDEVGEIDIFAFENHPRIRELQVDQR